MGDIFCSLSVASYSQHHLKLDKVSEDPDDVLYTFNYDTGSELTVLI